jgi:hypothetical protein
MWRLALFALDKQVACISPKETIYVRGCSIVAHFFSVRVEIVFIRNTSCNEGFSRSDRSPFVPNRPLQLSRRNTCISPKETTYVRNGTILHIVSL